MTTIAFQADTFQADAFQAATVADVPAFQADAFQNDAFQSAVDSSLSGTVSVAFSASGSVTIDSPSALSGSASVSFAASGALSAIAELSGSSSVAFSTSGALSVVDQNALTGSASLQFATSGSLTSSSAPVGRVTGGWVESPAQERKRRKREAELKASEAEFRRTLRSAFRAARGLPDEALDEIRSSVVADPSQASFATILAALTKTANDNRKAQELADQIREAALRIALLQEEQRQAEMRAYEAELADDDEAIFLLAMAA